MTPTAASGMDALSSPLPVHRLPLSLWERVGVRARVRAGDRAKAILEWGPDHPEFGHDRGHVPVRCDIKRRVPHVNAARSGACAPEIGNLIDRALFNWNLVAAGRRQINRTHRGRDVEGK